MSIEVVNSIWKDVLGIQNIQADDDFFELGGHSLHAIRVVAKIKKELDLKLPLNALFDYPVFANFIEQVILPHTEKGQ